MGKQKGRHEMHDCLGDFVFVDTLQSEEWALLRGKRFVGGVRVTDHGTPAARNCAITGGRYMVSRAARRRTSRVPVGFPLAKPVMPNPTMTAPAVVEVG